MNAFSQHIALTGTSEIPASRATAIVPPRQKEVAARRAARIALFDDCLETAFTGLVLLGCLLFAAAALRLCIAPCALRHWGVLSIYGVSMTLVAAILFATTKNMLRFKKSAG
jgi:hypothetical protein